MAGIVEIFGAPGVGKTTICHTIERKWKKSSNWFPANQIFPPFKKDNLLRHIKYRILHKVVKENAINHPLVMEAEKKFVSNHPRLMECYWKNIAKQPSRLITVDIRFEKAKFLQRRIQKVQFILDYEASQFCLVDEGIVHMLPGALGDNISEMVDETEVASILELCPLPLAIVHIDTNTKEIAQRLSKRSKIIPMHQNLSLPELEAVTQLSQERRNSITKILEKIGVPVLKIDSGLTTVQNADKIIAFLTDELPHMLEKVQPNFTMDPGIRLARRVSD